MITSFANPNRKGNSGTCHASYCNEKHAKCMSNACCTCVCNQDRTYDKVEKDCLLAATTRVPTTSSSASTRRTSETRTTTATPSTASIASTIKTHRPEITTSSSAPTTTSRTTEAKNTSVTTSKASTTASTTKALRPEITTQSTARTTYTTFSRPKTNRLLSTKQASSLKSTHKNPPFKKPTKVSGKTTVNPRTTAYTQKASTTGSPGNKNMIRGGNKSNAAAIAGGVVGVVILIVLAAVFLYLRKRKKKTGGAKESNGRAPLDVQFNDLKSREEVESPSSPDGIYTYADASTLSRPNGTTMNAVGNPVYNHNIQISEPVYNVLDSEGHDSQPVYREVVPEQVYMDPNENTAAGGNQDQQEQPIYRELEEEPPVYAPIDQPIYRELEDETPASPVYADVTSSTVDGAGAQSPRQYQELNYAATNNVYQPLDDGWKSQKYNR